MADRHHQRYFSTGLGSAITCLDGVPFKINEAFICPPMVDLSRDDTTSVNLDLLTREYPFSVENAVLKWVEDLKTSETQRQELAAGTSKKVVIVDSDIEADDALDQMKGAMQAQRPGRSCTNGSEDETGVAGRSPTNSEGETGGRRKVGGKKRRGIDQKGSGKSGGKNISKNNAGHPASFGSDLLTPIMATSPGHREMTGGHDSSGTDKLDISLFEKVDDPFDNLTLQTINDMEELRTVLQATNMQDDSPGGTSPMTVSVAANVPGRPSPTPRGLKTAEPSTCGDHIHTPRTNQQSKSRPTTAPGSHVGTNCNNNSDTSGGSIISPRLPTDTPLLPAIGQRSVNHDTVHVQDSTRVRDVTCGDDVTCDDDVTIYDNAIGCDRVTALTQSVCDNTERDAQRTKFLPTSDSWMSLSKSVPDAVRLRPTRSTPDMSSDNRPPVPVKTVHTRLSQARLDALAPFIAPKKPPTPAPRVKKKLHSTNSINSTNSYHSTSSTPSSSLDDIKSFFDDGFTNDVIKDDTALSPPPEDVQATTKRTLAEPDAPNVPPRTTSLLVEANTTAAQQSPLPPPRPDRLPTTTPINDCAPPIPSRQPVATAQHHNSWNHFNPLPTTMMPRVNDDPYTRMSIEARQFIDYVCNMGFPRARVARAVERFGQDHKVVVDHLCLVNKLSDLGYKCSQSEIALQLYSNDYDQAYKYLELFKQFQELGFSSDQIRNAIFNNNINRDKALDELTTS